MDQKHLHPHPHTNASASEPSPESSVHVSAPEESPPEETLEEKISRLEAEILGLTQEKNDCAQTVKDLRAAEDFKKVITFANEIFTNQQNKMRLEVEIELRRKKINRIKLGME